MNPRELYDLCMRSIEEWNEMAQGHGEPTILLVVSRQKCPSGQTIAMFGRQGPRGKIATIKETARGYDVAAYFSSVDTLNSLAAAFGMARPVVRLVRPKETQK